MNTRKEIEDRIKLFMSNIRKGLSYDANVVLLTNDIEEVGNQVKNNVDLANISKSVNCEHTGDEILHQGNGFIYKTCADCGEEI
jgi:hypothetical protein